MILLDTCVLLRILDGRYIPKIGFKVSAVTYGEGLRSGERAGETVGNKTLHAFLQGLDDDAVIPYTRAEAQIFARFAANITSPKRVADMMIAATALSTGLKLVTADRQMAALQSAIAEIPDLPPLMIEVVGV